MQLLSLQEAFDPAKSYALLFDVDLTLLPSMSTDITPEQTGLIFSLYERTKGATCAMTGRPGESVDKCFPGLPASVEHHSAWRPQRDGDYIALAPRLDTAALSAQARELINGFMGIFESSAQVLGQEPGVFIERKEHAMALVHSGTISYAQRELLETTVDDLIADNNLSATHRVARGSDAVELVPLHGFDGKALDKGVAVRHFMAEAAFKGRIPVVFGDSGTDLKAMKVAAAEYGGFGVAVGKGIPDDHVVKMRVATYHDTWPLLQQLLPMLR